jgi:hypothetical protein
MKINIHIHSAAVAAKKKLSPHNDFSALALNVKWDENA